MTESDLRQLVKKRMTDKNMNVSALARLSSQSIQTLNGWLREERGITVKKILPALEVLEISIKSHKKN